MMYADNFPIAQHVADVTGQKCRLIVKTEDKTNPEASYFRCRNKGIYIHNVSIP
jgi:hypothetical protein